MCSLAVKKNIDRLVIRFALGEFVHCVRMYQIIPVALNKLQDLIKCSVCIASAY